MRVAESRGGVAGAHAMTTQLIYADTSLWNELCNQAVDPQMMSSSFARQGAQLVLGMNVFFEMVKTFGMDEEGVAHRGSQLFSYLKAWVHDEFPVVRQTPEILWEEAMNSLGESRSIRVFLDTHEYRHLTEEIARLAAGKFDSSREGFIESRKTTAKRARDEMRNHFRAAPEIGSRLRKIRVDQLRDWLSEEARSEKGVSLLAGHLVDVLQEELFPKLRVIAENLLASDEYRVSHALVRNGIYLNWRLAHRGSVPTSSFDDAYHVVNASYCSKFLTTDKDQADQVSHSLASVHVRYYDQREPFGAWLTDNGC